MISEPLKWRALLVLAVIAASVALELSWTWGILFAFWVWPSIREGHLILWDDIFREDDPAIFWTTTLFILGLCLWLVLVDLLPFLEIFT